LEADKEWFKKQQEKKRGISTIICLISDSSPTVISKETYIQKIQELLPGVKLSDSVYKLIKKNKQFYGRLHDCFGWSREDAKNFINEAKMFLKTSTKVLVSKNKGYHFDEVVSHMGQGATIIQKVYDTKGNYCGKIGPIRIIEAEYEVGKKVVGPCVMPVLDFIILPEERAVIVSPLYIRTLANWMLNLEEFAEEDDIVPILLCGISAIYSFACQGLAHCDIKLTNLMLETSVKVILIDFGSATDFEEVISSTTPGIRFEHCSPSIRYDINSLSIAIARIMLKKNEDFATKEHLFSMISPLASRYPVVLEMLGLMRIDENFGSAAELLVVWKNIYSVAQEKKAFVCDYPFFAPPN
jgi:serine/threonine protein kinase